MNRKGTYLAAGVALSLLWGIIGHLGAQSVAAELSYAPTTQAIPYPDQRDAIEAAVVWLVTTHQNADGGYSSFSMGADQADSEISGSLDAILAISAAGYPASVPFPGKENSPIGYLRRNINGLANFAREDAGKAGKVVLALVAAGQDPRNFGVINFVALLTDHLTFSGQFDVQSPFDRALAIMALSVVGERVPETAVEPLIEAQASEGDLAGSWDDGFGTAGNVDATAMSVMALASTGMTITEQSLVTAADFLQRSRLTTGGWEYAAGLGESVNSTALAVQAIIALGQDVESPGESGRSPLTALLSWQGENGGFQADFGDGPIDDFFSTVQAVPAAAGRALPLEGHQEAAMRAADCLASLQDLATGGWEQFAGFGVNAGGTSRAIQSIAAVGEDPTVDKWTKNGIDAVRALENLTPAYLASGRGGSVGIVMQGVMAAGDDIHDFAGTDLVLTMSGHLSPTGEYDDTAFGPFSHTEAMLGLLVADEEVGASAVNWLLSAHSDGDFGGPDSTGIALQVLGLLGRSLPEAIAYLHSAQEADGGWGFGFANPNSSSEVVQGLVAIGQNPYSPSWSKVLSGTISNAADAVMSQQAENGCWPNLFGPGDDPFATTDAIILLTQRPGWGPLASLDEVPQLVVEETTPAAAEPAQTPAPTATPAPTDTPTESAVTAEVSSPTSSQPADAAPTRVSDREGAETPANNWTLVIIVAVVALIMIGYAGFRVARR